MNIDQLKRICNSRYHTIKKRDDEIAALRKIIIQAQKALKPFPRDQDDVLKYFPDGYMLMLAVPAESIREIRALMRILDAEIGVEECPDTQ